MAAIDVINVVWLQDLHGMIDAAKYADLVLLMVDGGFGFEMETFEFLNLLQVRPATPSSHCIPDLCHIAAAILAAAILAARECVIAWHAVSVAALHSRPINQYSHELAVHR